MAHPDWLKENPVDGTVLALVPKGPFLAGGPTHAEGGCGPFEVALPAFYLALHAVTNAQYKRFVDATGHPPPHRPPGAQPGEFPWEGASFAPARARHPVVGVGWEDARAYARWAGLRLPRELEWEKGARGVDGRRYPWGEEWSPRLCRNDESRKEETTCDVWAYGEGASVWGAYQMSGNVWEWCEDAFDAGAYRRYARGRVSPPQVGVERVVRGGSWFNVGSESFACAYRFHVAAEERDHLYGLRLVGDAP